MRAMTQQYLCVICCVFASSRQFDASPDPKFRKINDKRVDEENSNLMGFVHFIVTSSKLSVVRPC